MLVVGTKTNDPNQLIKIDFNGLCHHTLIVGQSGGGKSFLVARIVEEILLRSRARVLIVDPNGDFRQMSKPSTGVWTQFSEAFQKIDKQSLDQNEASFDQVDKFTEGWAKRRFTYLLPQRARFSPNSGDILDSLIVHWDTLEEDQRTFLLNANARIDPKIYMGLKAVSENARWVSANRPDVGIGYNLRGMRDVCEQFAQSNLSLREYEYAKLLSPEDWSAVRATLEDLLARYSLWWSSYSSKSSRPLGIADFVDGAFQNRMTSRSYWDALVLSLDSAAQSDTLLAAEVALARCWMQAKQVWRDAAERQSEDGFADKRVPTFIVVDEAHNFAPERTEDPLRQRVTQKLLQIASEGRKYGLYLILATQRPTKLHRELVPECENSCVLRLQSRVETDFASNVLGLSPEEKTQVPGFTLGQGVFFGRWVGGTQQLNTKVAPARIEVGGGGLPSEWKQLPEETPAAKSDGDELEEFLREILENSPEPIDLAALAGKFRVHFGKDRTSNWFGFFAFKNFLASLNVEGLKLSAVPPGYAYLSDTHAEPQEEDGILSNPDLSESEKEAIILVLKHLQFPVASKGDFRILFEQLSREVLANSFNLTDTSRNVRDKCHEAGANIGRSLVNFVLKGLHFAGHVYEPDLDQSPETLGETFARSILGSLEHNGVLVSTPIKTTILQYFSGGLYASDSDSDSDSDS